MSSKKEPHHWDHKEIPSNEIKVLETCLLCGLTSLRYKGARTYMDYKGNHLPYRPTCSPGRHKAVEEVKEDLMKSKEPPYEFMKHKEPEKPIKPFGGPGNGRGRFSGREQAKHALNNQVDWDKLEQFIKKGSPQVAESDIKGNEVRTFIDGDEIKREGPSFSDELKRFEAVPEDPNKPEGPYTMGIDIGKGPDINAMAVFYEGKVIGRAPIPQQTGLIVRLRLLLKELQLIIDQMEQLK